MIALEIGWADRKHKGSLLVEARAYSELLSVQTCSIVPETSSILSESPSLCSTVPWV
jgi:hypothetical protein